MSDLAGVAAVLRSVDEIANGYGPLSRMYRDLDSPQRRQADGGLRDPELAARLPDRRRVHWTVDVWLHQSEPDGPWSAVVKGDVDRDLTDDAYSDDECLFLEQRTVHDAAGAAAAVREMAELVVKQDVT